MENELLQIKDEALEKIEAGTSLKEFNEKYGSRSKKNIWSNK